MGNYQFEKKKEWHCGSKTTDDSDDVPTSGDAIATFRDCFSLCSWDKLNSEQTFFPFLFSDETFFVIWYSSKKCVGLYHRDLILVEEMCRSILSRPKPKVLPNFSQPSAGCKGGTLEIFSFVTWVVGNHRLEGKKIIELWVIVGSKQKKNGTVGVRRQMTTTMCPPSWRCHRYTNKCYLEALYFITCYGVVG